MSDETPSTEEGTPTAPAPTGPYELSEFEKDALGEVGNISMSAAAGILATLLSRPVQITTPTVELLSDAALRAQFDAPSAVIEVAYTDGLEGSSILVLAIPDAAVVADLMMGGEGTASDELTEMQSSAVAEAMNQMMGGAAGAIAELTGRSVQIAAPGVDIVDLAEGGAPGMSGPTTLLVRTSFALKVEGLLDTTLMQIMPVGFARLLLHRVASRPAGGAPVEPEVETAGESDEERHLHAIPATAPVARPVTFPTLEDASEAPGAGDIALLLDVPLQVTVELGRTQLRIRNVLELVPGSIVELDKLAGEPVDVLVNGKQIARGEVVVIDEEFGVRITEVASQAKRLHGIAVEEA